MTYTSWPQYDIACRCSANVQLRVSLLIRTFIQFTCFSIIVPTGDLTAAPYEEKICKKDIGNDDPKYCHVAPSISFATTTVL